MALLKGPAESKLAEIRPNVVSLVVVDPPYGVTSESWDTVCDTWWESIWKELDRVCDPSAVILVFGSEPFLSHRRLNAAREYRYDLVWDKVVPAGMAYAKKRPLQQTESIALFLSKSIPLSDRYFPVPRPRKNKIMGYATKTSKTAGITPTDKEPRTYTSKNPVTLLRCPKVKAAPSRPWLRLHTTQKPVPLLMYLICTYSREGETVLDFTMGSGSTGVAALLTKRNFIGIERDPTYFDTASVRIASYERERNHAEEVYSSSFLSPT